LVHEGLFVFGLACRGEIDREAFFLQPSGEVLRSLGIVLDQENAHVHSAATSTIAIGDRTPRRRRRVRSVWGTTELSGAAYSNSRCSGLREMRTPAWGSRGLYLRYPSRLP